MRSYRTYNSPPAMGGDSSKRVRFGGSDDEDDNLVDATELDFPNRKARRGAVKDTEGYHSDSSNEDDETMIKRNSTTNAMDEEDDMFGDGEPASGKTGLDGLNPKDNDTRVKDSGLQLKGDAGKGGKEFLDLGDIEGQEFDDKDSSAARAQKEAAEKLKKVTEDEIDYISGDEKANDDDAVVSKERKSATGMGFAISRFNMKDEMEGGRRCHFAHSSFQRLHANDRRCRERTGYSFHLLTLDRRSLTLNCGGSSRFRIRGWFRSSRRSR